ncbi:hypothetical protein EZ313_05625 [Ramlibacter henchirensis]|uniref:Uncharacterized protein n=1 Tax=Ramlibacter henchirensis TaxID=204072 RepID=A0A4Z0C5D6_9BURK|nr:hypothetical protein [Ramlibacter henchirensis]TFZ06122.1 hypothetical protein EZ313_05625 [Ramlibacter henchirensis]
MSDTELRTVSRLRAADVLQINNDVRLFRVLSVEKLTGQFAGRCKVLLRSLDDSGDVTLMRAPGDLILVVPRLLGPVLLRPAP